MAEEGGKTPIPEKQEQLKFLQGLAPPIIATVVALSPICNIHGNNRPPTCFRYPLPLFFLSYSLAFLLAALFCDIP